MSSRRDGVQLRAVDWRRLSAVPGRSGRGARKHGHCSSEPSDQNASGTSVTDAPAADVALDRIELSKSGKHLADIVFWN